MANPSITAYQTNTAPPVQTAQKTFNVKIGKNYSAARGNPMTDTDTVNISREGRNAVIIAASAASDLPNSQKTIEAQNAGNSPEANNNGNAHTETSFQQGRKVSVEIAIAAKTAAEARANAAAQAAAEAKAAAGSNTNSAAASAAALAAAEAQNAAAAYAIAAAQAANAERNAAYS